MPTGKLRNRAARHDFFYERARREGFAGRAVYKLAEVDRRTGLLRRGMRVLDLGCWPGSWLQYTARIVGPTGVLVGVDRFPLEVPIPSPGVRQVVGDVFDLAPQVLLGSLPAFDVVLSDMAPDTTGVRSTDQARSEALFARALELAEALLAPGGSFCGKLFQGPGWQDLLQRCRGAFNKVRIIRPEGSRQGSLEQYVVGLGRK
ncbi:MAG: RlmE family RNA methyltransferase [Myxococcales bacterium]|nr:RlmE family RNA methyltransferase [Myxococcota bacterium]MDW8283678.1 RlmE family RNA methyltransferase [Myxococcales bacterium]